MWKQNKSIAWNGSRSVLFVVFCYRKFCIHEYRRVWELRDCSIPCGYYFIPLNWLNRQYTKSKSLISTYNHSIIFASHVLNNQIILILSAMTRAIIWNEKLYLSETKTLNIYIRNSFSLLTLAKCLIYLMVIHVGYVYSK